MDKALYQEHRDLEDRHWWFIGRRAVIESFLEMLPENLERALDIGCGTGRNALLLQKYIANVGGIEDSEEAVELAKRRVPEIEIKKMSFPEESPAGLYNLVTLFDVLEHIEDDGAALRKVERLTAPGGHLLITVPALSILWSEHDEIAHHKRRYTQAGIRRLFQETSFEIVRLSYFNAALFLPVILVRLIKKILCIRTSGSDFFMPPRPLNTLLLRIFSFEATLLRYGSLPFGVSLICLAKKP